MYGVGLEGGGAKGAYQIGAMKALKELNIEIGGIVGTSIGSFNAAVIAQGDFDKLYELWWSSSITMILDIEENELHKVVKSKLDLDGIKYFLNYFIQGISNKGLDSNKLRKLYEEYIDEDKLRKSKIDYGMVTVSLTDKKPLEVYKEDIEKGMISSYVLASSFLPVFKQEKLINDKNYIDGGFYDNCPISLLINKGYKNIIRIMTGAISRKRKVDTTGINVITITPSKNTGSILFSDNDSMRNNIMMGYFDAIRVLKGYIGKEYYVIPTEDKNVLNSILSIRDGKIIDIIKELKLTDKYDVIEPKKYLLSNIIPEIELKLKGQDTSSYQKLIVSIIEHFASERLMKIYKFYTFEEFVNEFKLLIPKLLKKEESQIIKNTSNILMLKFLNEIKI